jgi:hypothetical protein
MLGKRTDRGGRPKAKPGDPQVPVNAARVRAALLLSGLSQREVVAEARRRKLAPLTLAGVHNLGAGEQATSRQSRLQAFAAVTGVPWEWLMKKSGELLEPRASLDTQAFVELIALVVRSRANVITAGTGPNPSPGEVEALHRWVNEAAKMLGQTLTPRNIAAVLNLEAWRLLVFTGDHAGRKPQPATPGEMDAFSKAMGRALLVLLHPWLKRQGGGELGAAALQAAGEWIERELVKGRAVDPQGSGTLGSDAGRTPSG